MTKTLRSVLWLALFLAAFQTQLFSSDKELERDYWWCTIPFKWCEWGIEHCCNDTDDDTDDCDDEEGCWVDCDDVCVHCYLEAFSPKFPGNHKRMPKSYRTEISWEYLPRVEWRGNCVVCENKCDRGKIKEEAIRKPSYAGYLQLTYSGGYPFLIRQIEYTKKYPKYQAYWPETSAKAENINNVACKFLNDLVDSTALKNVRENSTLQKDFPSDSWFFAKLGYCLHISLACQCFRFTDYCQVAHDLQEYCRKHFCKSECCLIEDKIIDLLEELAPLFLDMWEESMARHPTPEIATEIEFIKNKRRVVGSANSSNAYAHLAGLGEASAKTMALGPFDNARVLDEEFAYHHFAVDQQRPDWALAMWDLAKGEVYNDLLLHKAAVDILTNALSCNPKLADAYLERAHAYFELGDIDHAISDYKKYREINGIPPLVLGAEFLCSRSYEGLFDYQGGLYYPDHPLDFAQGLCEGTLEGASTAAEEFFPSVLSCCRGILNGLWSFACAPKEVTEEILDTADALLEYLISHSTQENLELLIPELKELCQKWNQFSDRTRGQRIGYIIGKYGLDVFAPGATLKAIAKYRALKRANTALTLECCLTEAKRAKILTESTKRAELRQKLVSEITRGRKIRPKVANAIPHILQEKHAWERVVSIKQPIGSKENMIENFKAVVALLEEENIISEAYFESTVFSSEKLRINRHEKMIKGEKVRAFFEINLEDGSVFLQDAYVVTK